MGKLKVAIKNQLGRWDVSESGERVYTPGLFDIIGYKPHPGQIICHENESRFKTIRSGRRWGKSLFAAMDVMDLICTPGSRGWIVAPNYSLGEKEWRYIWDALFGGSTFPRSGLKDMIYKIERKTNNPVQGQMYLKFYWAYDIALQKPELGLSPQPVEIIVKSFDNRVSLLGDELDWIILSEGSLFLREIWEKFLQQTLTSREGRLSIPSTSSDVSDFMDDFYKLGQNPAEIDYFSREAPSYENPHWAPNVEKEKSRLLKLVATGQMSEEAYEEQIEGKKVNYTGRYYKEFNHRIHVQDLEVDPHSVAFRAWDFGYRHPSIIWAQINKQDQMLWLHTYLGSDLDDIDLCWLGMFLSGELLVDKNLKFYRVGSDKKREYLPKNIYNRIKAEQLLPFFNSNTKIEFNDFCDAYGGVQEKSSRGSSIQVMNTFGLYPRYTFERIKNDETEPESVKIIRADLKLREHKVPNFIVNRSNTLGVEMFRNLSFEKRKDGAIAHKYKKEGYYEHPHDCLRYLEKHTRKYMLYKYKNLVEGRYSYAK